MTHSYQVHRADRLDAQVPVTLPGGQSVPGIVPSFVVELVPVDHHSGTWTLTYSTPEEIAEAEKVFITGATVTITIVGTETDNG